MSGSFNRFLSAVLLLCALCAHAVPVERAKSHLTDSLEVRLQEINNPDDSIATLYNIYDLSSTVKARSDALHKIYLTARLHGRERVKADVLLHLLHLYHDNDSILNMIGSELDTFPEGASRKELKLYVRMLQSEDSINGKSQKAQSRYLNDIVKKFTENPPEDSYHKAELLFALCIAMSKSTQGEVLEHYLMNLQELVDSMNISTGAIRNLVYSRSAPIFTRNRLYGAAIAIDKKLLNVLDSLALNYEGHGRPYRKLYSNRYEVCRRMLINYRGLMPEEVEFFHNAVGEMAMHDQEVGRRVRNEELTEIFYHQARKEYATALPILKRQLDNPLHHDIRTLLLRELVIAAEAVGDFRTQIDAAMELNEIYDARIEDRDRKRYRELQILYDFSDLKKASADKLLRDKESILRLNRWILGIVVCVCLVLVVMVVVMWRQYRRIRHLAAEHLRTTDTLRVERNDLKRVQNELIEARDKACESEKQKTEFTNMMSHEVKAPLAAVQEYSRLIVDCIPSEQKTYLDRFAYIIEQNVKILNRLVSDVLDMSSLEFGTMSISKSVESIDNICLVAIDSVFNNGKASSESVRVIYNARKQPDAMIVTDMARVTQVLMNLLDNANKFTEKGTISLEYEVDDISHQVRFIVTDTGVGIPDNSEEIIFERYRKLSPMTRGLGLGLYISRKIAILLKGDVRVDTDYHGGARFIFTIMKEDWAEEE